MAERGARLPKYHRIADDLRDQIRDGALRPGDRLPAETAIAATHAASVPTVRHAMSVLRAEGLIDSRHGIGTFVRDSGRLQRRARNRYGDQGGRIDWLDNTVRLELTFAGTCPLPEHIAACFNLEPGTPAVTRRCHVYDETNNLTEIGASYLPTSFAAGTILEQPDALPKPLFLCVEELTGRTYTAAVDDLTARHATEAEAQAFDVPLHSYVVHLIHAASDEHGDVLEVSESIWPADRVTLMDRYPIPAVGTETSAQRPD
ncbi:GntR family transcriptional regulator [Intrasporangium mesophilum]